MDDHQPLGSILRLAYGFWGSAILAAALRHRIFDFLAGGARTAAEVADRASIAPRGCEALLNGLVGLGVIARDDHGFSNVAAFLPLLVRGGEGYVGGYADMILSTLGDWSKLPDAVASGFPLHMHERADPNNKFWESQVRATAPLARMAAQEAAERLRLQEKAGFRMLDVGGGAGAYSAIWLGLHPRSWCCQIDWPNVNAIAREYVAAYGHSARFETIDGDMESIDLADRSFDYVVYSNVAHGLSADRNLAMFRRIRGWLCERGTLIIASLLPNDDGSGDPLVLMAECNLLLNTKHGRLHVGSDYRRWLGETGFSDIEFRPMISLPVTLIYAS